MRILRMSARYAGVCRVSQFRSDGDIPELTYLDDRPGPRSDEGIPRAQNGEPAGARLT
jgi:hypothetical protein